MENRQWGVLAMVVSGALWIAVFVVPFLPGSAQSRLVAAVILYGGSYAAFFLGGALLGPEAMQQGRRWLRSKLGKPPGAEPTGDEPPEG